jgi:hypothetical protein
MVREFPDRKVGRFTSKQRYRWRERERVRMQDEQDHSASLLPVDPSAPVQTVALPNSDDDCFDADGYRDPWCRAFEAHRSAHEFCGHHQISWCRVCDRECPDCVDDPRCPDCGCHLREEYHDWDCCYADED